MHLLPKRKKRYEAKKLLGFRPFPQLTRKFPRYYYYSTLFNVSTPRDYQESSLYRREAAAAAEEEEGEKKAMDAFFGDPLKKIISHTLTAREWSGSLALMDWLETPTSHIFKINVPGYSKDELKMQVEEGGKVLHIRGEVKKEDPSVKDAIWHVSERGAIKGEFNRVIRLPENVNLDEIKAKIEDGVLTVIVPKESASKSSKLRPISISSPSKL